MRHELDIDEAFEYEFRHRIAGQHGRGRNKTLDAIVKGTSVRFEVRVHRELIGEYMELTQAVHVYNRLEGTEGKE